MKEKATTFNLPQYMEPSSVYALRMHIPNLVFRYGYASLLIHFLPLKNFHMFSRHKQCDVVQRYTFWMHMKCPNHICMTLLCHCLAYRRWLCCYLIYRWTKPQCQEACLDILRFPHDDCSVSHCILNTFMFKPTIGVEACRYFWSY